MRYLMTLFLLITSPLLASHKLVIGIAGGTGSGKTTLAEKLLKTFADRAILISQDDYYKDRSDLPKEARAKQNYDHPDSIDFDLLNQHILALKDNCEIEKPIYNFREHARERQTQIMRPADIIVIEGILLFAVRETRDLFDFKIFVETDDDVRLLRRIERDMTERARDFVSIRDQYMTTVKPMHDAFVEPSKRFADVIIPTMRHNENGIALIISGLKNRL